MAENTAPEAVPTTDPIPSNNWGGNTNKVITADAEVHGAGKLDPKEQQKMHALLGGGKKQATTLLHNKKAETIQLKPTDVDASHTLVLKDCGDCHVTVDAMVTKIMIDGCQNTTLVLNQKIITAVVELYRCENFTVESNTKIGTLQADMCKKFAANFQSKELFTSLVWAGVHDLSLSFKDSPVALRTGFTEMQTEHPDLHEERGQFIVRFVKDELLNERIVRLDNGFPTTERERKEFDERQEENLRKLAGQAGIQIGRKKAEQKIKPNEICPKCKSGKKYKKCCGQGGAQQ